MINKRPESERIVVTGMGAVSSIGTGRDSFWSSLLAGRSGVSEIEGLDLSGLRTTRGGQIKDFNAADYFAPDQRESFGRTSQLAIAGAKLALADASLGMHDLSDAKVCTIMGTTNGEAQVLESIQDLWLEKGEDQIPPREILKYPGNIIAMNVSRALGIDAVSIVIPTACAAGNYAIGYGFDKIRSHQASVVIAGGADGFSRVSLAGFNRMFAVAPEKCQPFDKNRKGMIVGEGAAILILESLEHALARRAPIIAEILGYALSCDASHMTIPSVEGLTAVMRGALRDAETRLDDVDYISAHGTGTQMNDKVESMAVNRVFSGRKGKVPVSSIKSMLGHTMGAASALEAIACAMAVHEDKIPPTINFETYDEECDVDCVPNFMRDLRVRTALNNSFAFGGNNACVVFSKLS